MRHTGLDQCQSYLRRRKVTGCCRKSHLTDNNKLNRTNLLRTKTRRPSPVLGWLPKTKCLDEPLLAPVPHNGRTYLFTEWCPHLFSPRFQRGIFGSRNICTRPRGDLLQKSTVTMPNHYSPIHPWSSNRSSTDTDTNAKCRRDAQIEELLELAKNINFLRRIIKPGRLEIVKETTKEIRDLQKPKTQIAVRFFLGLYNIFRRFVQTYLWAAALLIKKLREYQPNAFLKLKTEEKQSVEVLEKT